MHRELLTFANQTTCLEIQYFGLFLFWLYMHLRFKLKFKLDIGLIDLFEMNCILLRYLTKSLLRCNEQKMSSQVRDQQSATKFLTGMASRHVVLRQNALSFHTNLHPSSYLPEVAALLVNCFMNPYKFDWEVSERRKNPFFKNGGHIGEIHTDFNQY